jgi:hypothetical protein
MSIVWAAAPFRIQMSTCKVLYQDIEPHQHASYSAICQLPDRIIGERLGAADIARAVEIIGSFIDQHRRRLLLYHRR